MRGKRRLGIAVIAAALGGTYALAGTAGAATAGAATVGPTTWPMAGHDIANTRSAPAETTISANNVAKLKPKWTFTANGDVIDTPAVVGGVTYLTDQGSADKPSTLWAITSDTGRVIWSKPISSYTGIDGDTSRSTPTVAGGLLILGDRAPLTASAGAWLFAVKASTGALVWKVQLDAHPAAVVTSSPSVYGSLAYVGVSSLEEELAGQAGYPCCTFRGSVAAVNIQTGRLAWKTYMMPDNGGKPGGYSGGSVWGSTPAIDVKRSLVYVATGNSYTVPAGVCTAPDQTGCQPPAAAAHSDSIVAMNIYTGAIAWATPTLTNDVFTTACTNPAEECGPDFDFGSGPNLYTATTAAGTRRDLVGVGQKSGVYFALDASSGQIVWQTKIGPGTQLGGIEWGSATDGKRIYAAESDLYGVPYTVNGTTITGGSWAALDAGTGKIVWQTPDPQGAADLGFVSTANGVVYAPSDAGTGNNMYALDAATGAIKWSFASGGSVVAGAGIVNGTVYWGSGYYIGTENNKLYAFGL